MPKVRYIRERRQTFQTVPPGVIIAVEAGKVYETDGGFEYLLTHPDFKLVEAPKPAVTDGGGKKPEPGKK